ncbi:MAG: TraR/DksA C4-type zinc finger protein [Balneolaceae bacterium]
MTPSEKKIIVQKIHQLLKATSEEITQLQELTKPVQPDNAIGRLSRMDAINNKAINDAALIKQKKLKQRLEKTLQRIDDPNFGMCMKCGNPIPFGRLESLPHTTRCIECA